MSQGVLLVDLDGVVADYDGHFFERCAESGFVLDVEPAGQQHRYATDHVIDPKERKLARAMTNEPGWFRSLPVMPGAVDGLKEIRFALGEDAVWLCTKPAIDNPTCRDEKFAWVLAHLGKSWARKLIIASDKSMVRGTVLLDDAPNPDWFDRAEWRPVIYSAPFNGEGSKWADLPHFTWGDPCRKLYEQLYPELYEYLDRD